ncbi:MAG TPA: glutamine-hydrolyzing carbamoyl-phosphate synthase small subunit [Anaerolineales bacterium]|nr:glutamine-hydrolyzing carbamoyl-phosphate synthase small subunit [Anaerolineales bacterium]
MANSQPALLVLEDGTQWQGVACGALGERTGELVFNTSMTGYQEILTDPSYHGEIVVMTQPHIGNYGTTPEDEESRALWLSGFVMRAVSPTVSNWRSTASLPDYLAKHGVVAISEVDTRALVRHIRDHGAMRAALSSVNLNPAELLTRARHAPDMSGQDLVRQVTCQAAYQWDTPSLPAWQNPHQPPQPLRYHVVAYDFGIKRNILRLLVDHGCRVTVVPAHTPAHEVLALQPDGVFLSNGPGDPAAVTYAIENVRQLLGKVPLFGICLGHQLLGLALGGKTYKLKFGHRGGNQPVQVNGKQVQISAHNHGFAVQADSLPTLAQVTHINLNDNCVEGLAVPSLNAFSIQYHPEAAPGPWDARGEFGRFIEGMGG